MHAKSHQQGCGGILQLGCHVCMKSFNMLQDTAWINHFDKDHGRKINAAPDPKKMLLLPVRIVKSSSRISSSSRIMGPASIWTTGSGARVVSRQQLPLGSTCMRKPQCISRLSIGLILKEQTHTRDEVAGDHGLPHLQLLWIASVQGLLRGSHS